MRTYVNQCMIWLLLVFAFANGAPRIAFRIEGIQDYWIRSVQQAVIGTFNKVPVTLGVITDSIGHDLSLVSYLQFNVLADSSWKVEIAHNGVGDDDFTVLTPTEQLQILEDGQYRLKSLFYLPVVETFIPTNSKYNSTSDPVLIAAGFTHVSSSMRYDPQSSYPLQGQTLFHFPSGAATQAFASSTRVTSALAANTVFSLVSSQIASYGFSVVSVLPQAFAVLNENGNATNVVNQTALAELQQLVQLCQSAGYEFTTIGTLNTDAPTQPPVSTAQRYTCNCVSFRLDGIEDDYQTDAQIAVMDTFKQFSFPLTLGVIANHFGSDSTIVDYVKNAVSNSTMRFQVASNGYDWGNEDFSTMDMSQQLYLLNQSANAIQTVTGYRPTIFDPPRNKFNSSTTPQAMEQAGYHILSSHVRFDTPPYDYNASRAIIRLPAYASTYDQYSSQYTNGLTHDVILTNIKNQVMLNGFAVVMMKPTEFTTQSGNTNTSMISELSLVLQGISSSRLTVSPMDQVPSLFQLIPSTTGAPITSTTTADSSTTTADTTAAGTTGNFTETTTGDSLTGSTTGWEASTTGQTTTIIISGSWMPTVSLSLIVSAFLSLWLY